ncbi:MAG: FAD-dependent oxidoreductase [Candidatus Peribacteraceae bacterium]|nr:FAD-dependent oxidoreductase [Candidatus Peribacteraceae bacterium]MDD5074991.1 FAD-dependent oxidoreductase [Candidatus Peribacteraceae bacterium]
MFDVAIIGLGAAGYTAAIYAARYKLSTLIVGEEEGGMGVTAAEVGNWPGDIEVSGPDLMERMKKHVQSFKEVTHKSARVVKVEKAAGGFRLQYEGGGTDESRTVIFATGSKKRQLGVAGEKEFAGKGVSYCATCDAFFYRGKTVAVVGGGDAAVEGAAILAQVAKQVYLIHRRKEFRAEPYWSNQLKEKTNVTFVLERSVKEIVGDGKVTGLALFHPFNGSDRLAVDGVFIEIGADPAVELAQQLKCALDDRGYLKVGADQQTSVPGAFAAGDVSGGSNHFAQFVTAAGEGAVAVSGVFAFLQERGA